MPCSDGCYSADPDSRRIRQTLETLLCDACRLLEGNNVIMTTMLAQWWVGHKEEDRKRVAREVAENEKRQKKAEALAKLTPYERSLLGYRD